LWPRWGDGDRSVLGFVEYLHLQINQVAITGKATTSQMGAVFKQVEQ
jgi:hypothetical protein